MHKILTSKWLARAIFMLLIAACYSVGLSAQRVSEKNVGAKSGGLTTIDSLFNTTSLNFVLTDPDFSASSQLSNGNRKIIINNISTPILGTRQITVQYGMMVNGVEVFNYRIYNITFSKSFVKANDDFVKWNGIGTLEIDVLANDDYNYSNPIIKINQSSGNASVVNGKIQYSNSNFEGSDFVHYTLIDSIGTLDVAIIKIEQEDNVTEDEIHYFTLNYLASKEITVPQGSVVAEDPLHGTLTAIDAEHYTYQPYSEINTDSFKFTSGAYTIAYYAKIIDVQKDPGVVKNDVFYVAKNNVISFDVLNNDLVQNLTIDTFSQQLTHDTLGVFSYTSGSVAGTKNFWYKSTTAVGQETGKIKIVVDNFVPNQDIPYKFELLKNTELAISYNVPIEDYGFMLTNQMPAHGLVSIATDSLSLTCGTAYGKTIISYIPDSSYEGMDEFVLNYCINGGQCVPVKITVETVNESMTSCPCVDDCVFKGDLNGDGRVAADDLLVLGRYLGHTGPVRTLANVQANIGEEADDWQTSTIFGQNLKHADANGDGNLTDTDKQSIIDNFGKTNTLVKTEQLASKDYELKLIVDPAEADSGDLVTIYFQLGTGSKPVNDMFGLSFGLNFNWGDSASVAHEFYNKTWFTDNSPTLSIFKQISDGNIRAAFTRTAGSGISGNGIIGQMSVIVDEVDGVRQENADYSINPIVIDDIIMEDNEGQKFTLTSSDTSIKIYKKRNKVGVNKSDLLVFPNPSEKVFFIKSQNNSIIKETCLYNNLGNIVVSHYDVDNVEDQISAENLPTGIYLLKVRTEMGIEYKKVVKN